MGPVLRRSWQAAPLCPPGRHSRASPEGQTLVRMPPGRSPDSQKAYRVAPCTCAARRGHAISSEERPQDLDREPIPYIPVIDPSRREETGQAPQGLSPASELAGGRISCGATTPASFSSAMSGMNSESTSSSCYGSSSSRYTSCTSHRCVTERTSVILTPGSWAGSLTSRRHPSLALGLAVLFSPLDEQGPCAAPQGGELAGSLHGDHQSKCKHAAMVEPAVNLQATLLRGRRAARRLGALAPSGQTDGRQTPPISPPTRVGRMAPWNGYSGHPQYIGTIGGLGSLRAVRRPECGRVARVSSLSKAEATWVDSI